MRSNPLLSPYHTRIITKLISNSFLKHVKLYAGHTRQGLRCRICKVNVHADCAPQLQKCQVKAKLLRRQKSTSEIENRIEQDEESKYTVV